MNHQGGELPIAGADLGTHELEWCHDAPHGALGERIVALDHAFERLTGKDSGQHPDSRARIPCIKRRSGRAQALKAATFDFDLVAFALPRHAERAKASKCRRAIRAGGVVAQDAAPACQRREHRIAV